MISLSEFSYTPTNSPTNSLTDDEGGAQQEQAHSPDQIQMDVEIPRVQVTGYPIEVKVEQTPMPFPPTPEQTEVSEPGPVVKPNSYRDIKDSLYFKENMVKTKRTKKLSAKEKESLLLAGEATPATNPGHSAPKERHREQGFTEGSGQHCSGRAQNTTEKRSGYRGSQKATSVQARHGCTS